MSDEIVKKLLEVLKDQQKIFGPDLFETDFPQTLNLQYSAPEEEIIPMKQTPKTEIPVEDAAFNSACTLDELYGKIWNCLKCPLGNTRNKLVFGTGNHNADIMVIGEGPGADEDMQGEPFVGRAGKLLTDILKAINFSREEVYIANIVKCRPPGNRNPLPAEMEKCFPYLKKQIDLIRPKLILCLGLISANAILGNKLSMGKMRGNVYEFNGIKVMVTYHPAALLRNPNWKRETWTDVQIFRKLYDELVKN